MADEYVSLNEVKDYLAIKATHVADDPLLNIFRESASRTVDEFCCRTFSAAASVSARTYVATNRFVIGTGDIYTTDGLVVETDTSDDGTFDTTWSSTDYQLEPLNGVVEGVSGHPFTKIRAVGTVYFPCSRRGRATVRVTAKWGWENVPPTVKDVTLALVKDLYKAKDSIAGVVGFGEFGAIRIRENPILKARLGPYRHPSWLVVG